MGEKQFSDTQIATLYDQYVHGALSRREFLGRLTKVCASATAAAATFAALTPNYSLAQQVAEDDASISVSYKKYASPEGAGVMQGYYARPKVIQHKLPAVVVVHENRGLNPYIEDVARRLAVAGFIAFAPDALTPLGGYPGNDDDGRAMQKKRSRDEMRADFAAAVDYLDTHPDSNGKVGIVGFCFGGSMAMRLAIDVPALDAAVAFYGGHPDASEAAAVGAPLMLHHGESDTRVNASWPAFESALKKSNKHFESFMYESAGHGFHNDSTGRFNKDAAELAWQRTLAFFTKYLSTRD